MNQDRILLLAIDMCIAVTAIVLCACVALLLIEAYSDQDQPTVITTNRSAITVTTQRTPITACQGGFTC